MIHKQFYSELGKLLYSIADVDGVITKTEKLTMQELVRKELVPLEKHTDEFGTDAAYYTEIEFDILEDSNSEPDVAFESFISYIENHKTALDRRMLEITRNIATRLADTFHHTNRKEKELLEVLNKKIGQILKEKPHTANR